MDLQYSIGEALGTDYFGLREPFTPQQESYLVKTRDFVDTEVLPVINDYWEKAEFPWALIEKIAPLGIFGDGIKGYGVPPMDPLSVGLINMELNRGDGSLGTFMWLHQYQPERPAVGVHRKPPGAVPQPGARRRNDHQRRCCRAQVPHRGAAAHV
jgi:alkylation response protein AidB-like acyl-CoA dehydrogenase